MRTSIEKLAWLLSDVPGDVTLGQLADRHGETIPRIMDALDVLKIRRGEPTQLPAVDWNTRPPSLVSPVPAPGPPSASP